MKTGIDISHLRHPWERTIWWLSVALNAALCLGAIFVVVREGAGLFERFPFLGQYQTQIRGIALAAVLAPPLLVFTRNRRLARVRGGGVKVSATQFGPLDRRFRAHCESLRLDVVPTLYVSDEAVDDPARAFSSWRREFVILGTDYLEKNLEDLEDVWSFLMGRELGRLAFGHVSYRSELLLAYVDRIPWVHRPLRHVRAYSLDAVGAFLEPEGVRALVIQASGRRVIPSANIAEQIRYALGVGGFWIRLTNLTDEQAHLSTRMQRLYGERLFDLDHDLARFGAPSAASDE